MGKGSRSEYEARDDHSVETHEDRGIHSNTLQTSGENLMPLAERGGWPPEDLWVE